ncbi:hypothetical protein GcLGCM259_2822 [Glutamicibacter creatinolyticus]|uniref:Uncharacterized protein n=1 Tax=Glutamicibacter creatinolyticus TaxID=162496 RepID=A0A5B7WX78_9MICC|nr:hypothetical protein [Glutamicibacter creatinolyticus]QCY48529.1 hypothetical protein GcLGCM259_2822 [Glutamicibacter creatinolyticus]
MSDTQFLIETPEQSRIFLAAGSAADFLLAGGFANAGREPHWHLRWCLERMQLEEFMEVGQARVFCQHQE